MSVACSSSVEQPRPATAAAWQLHRGSAAPRAATVVLHVGCRAGMCGGMDGLGMGWLRLRRRIVKPRVVRVHSGPMSRAFGPVYPPEQVVNCSL